MENTGTIFDKKIIFDEKIKDAAENLSRLCKQNNMPFFWTVCTGNGGAGTTYVSDGTSAAARGMNVMDDRVPKHLAVAMGFDVAKPEEEIDAGYLDFGMPDDGFELCPEPGI